MDTHGRHSALEVLCVAVASCRLPPLLARIRSSAQSQPTACTARPGSTPSQGSNKVQSLTRLPTLDGRLDCSTVPTTGDCAFALVPDEAPPPSALQAPLSLQQRREFGWARVHIVVIALEPQPAVQRPAHVREQQFPSCSPAPSFTSVASVAAVLCFLPGHYCSSGMCLCRSCGINIGPLG